MCSRCSSKAAAARAAAAAAAAKANSVAPASTTSTNALTPQIAVHTNPVGRPRKQRNIIQQQRLRKNY